MSLDSHDYKILLKTVYGEARGEWKTGQVAVAWVIRNRARLNKSYWGGSSIAAVCQHPGQFECWKYGDIQMDEYDARKSIEEWLPTVYTKYKDPTGGCDHFNNPQKEGYPSWTNNCDYVMTIGGHNFYKTKPQFLWSQHDSLMIYSIFPCNLLNWERIQIEIHISFIHTHAVVTS